MEEFEGFRVISSRSACVYTNKQVSDYWHGYHNVPLLVVNETESNPEALREIINSGLYKKLYCSPERFDGLPIDFISRELDFDKQTRKEYAAGVNNKERQAVLEKLYDTRLAELDLDKLSKSLNFHFVVNNPVFKVVSNALDWISTFKENNPDHFLVKLFGHNIYTISEADSIRRQQAEENVEKMDWLKAQLASLPPFLKTVLQDAGVQVAITDISLESKSHVGRSIYRHGVIETNPKTHWSVVHEEAIHQADSHISFSIRQNWRDAVAIDITPENEMLAKYYRDYNKASLFDGKAYSPESRPAEALADIHNIFTSQIPQEEILKHFPHTFPLYRDFVYELVFLADKINDPELYAGIDEVIEESIQEPPAKGRFTDRIASRKEFESGSELQLGGKSTTPTQRNSWVKSTS